MAPRHTPVVFDVNVLIDAYLARKGDISDWPKGVHPAVDAMRYVNDDRYFSLMSSDHILWNVNDKLINKYKVPEELANEYVWAIEDMIADSGGDIVENPPRIADYGPDHEDNQVLDLVRETGALILVSSDQELIDLSGYHGNLVLRPTTFANRTASAYRHDNIIPHGMQAARKHLDQRQASGMLNGPEPVVEKTAKADYDGPDF